MEKYFETTRVEDATHIKVSVSYQPGGLNSFTHKEEQRGIYVFIYPVKLIPRDGYTIEQVTAYSGCKTCVKEQKRDAPKSVEAIWERLQESIEMLVSMFEDGRIDLVDSHLRATDWSPRKKYFVICSDRIWKDNLVCICKDQDEAEMVAERWKSHSDKMRVRIVNNEPSYNASWYKVSEEGSIVKVR